MKRFGVPRDSANRAEPNSIETTYRVNDAVLNEIRHHLSLAMREGHPSPGTPIRMIDGYFTKNGTLVVVTKTQLKNDRQGIRISAECCVRNVATRTSSRAPTIPQGVLDNMHMTPAGAKQHSWVECHDLSLPVDTEYPGSVPPHRTYTRYRLRPNKEQS